MKWNRSKIQIISIYAFFSVVATALILGQIWKARTVALNELKESVVNQATITEAALLAVVERINTSLYDYTVKYKENSKLGDDATLVELYKQKAIFEDIPGLEFRQLDKEGKVRAATMPNGSAPFPFGRDNSKQGEYLYFQNNASDKLYVSNPTFAHVRGTWVIRFARRLVDKRGNFSGVVYAAVESRYFDSFHTRVKNDRFNLFAVSAGPDLLRIFRFPHNDAIIGKAQDFTAEEKPIQYGTIHSDVYDTFSPVDGKHRYIAFSRVGNYPIVILIGQDIEVALSSWRTNSFSFILGLFLVNLVGLALIILYLRSLQAISAHQEQLASASKMAVLGEMASGIAHEINNPLAITLGVVHQMNRKLESGEVSKADILKGLQKIQTSSMRVEKIVKGLRTFSRNSHSDPLEPTSIQTIIAESMELCHEKLSAAGITIKLEENIATKVYCRPSQISQVLINLVNNAVDAIRNQSEKWIKISVKQLENGKVRVSIVDAGPGIPAETAERLMQPFFTTKGVGKGTGLGLSISRGIISDHGGELVLDRSCPNTCFYFDLAQTAETAATKPDDEKKIA